MKKGPLYPQGMGMTAKDSARYCQMEMRRDSERYKPFHKLTSVDRREIYEYAMQRSDEILRGVDSVAGKHFQYLRDKFLALTGSSKVPSKDGNDS